MTAVTVGHAPIALLFLFFVPVPDFREVWPWFIGSILCHILYQLCLVLSYRLGDYTQVYPIARGSAPLWVTLVSLAFLDVNFGARDLLGIFLVCAGIMALAFHRQADGLRNGRAVWAALLTGCFIAGYSLFDGLGARAAETPLGYLAWLMLANGAIFCLGTWLHDRAVIVKIFTKERASFLFGGTASLVAYGIVVWAMFTAPIALVAALRETSAIFALFIGFLFLNEKPNLRKISAILTVLAGVAILRVF